MQDANDGINRWPSGPLFACGVSADRCPMQERMIPTQLTSTYSVENVFTNPCESVTQGVGGQLGLFTSLVGRVPSFHLVAAYAEVRVRWIT
jgi:hypothetical protein